MSYFQDIDRWLGEILKSLPAAELEAAKRAIKEKILESYRSRRSRSCASSGKPRCRASTSCPPTSGLSGSPTRSRSAPSAKIS